MVRRGDALYIGTLTPLPPLVPGAAVVFKVDLKSGGYTVFARDLTAVLGLAFDREGALYVLETAADAVHPDYRLRTLDRSSRSAASTGPRSRPASASRPG